MEGQKEGYGRRSPVMRAKMEGKLIAVENEAKEKSLVTPSPRDQCRTPPCRQRRTSLEKHTIQENPAEVILRDGMQSGSKSNQKAVKIVKETKGEPSEKLHGAVSGATGTILGPDTQSGVSDPPAVSDDQEPQRLVLGTSRDTTFPVRDHPVNTAQQSYARPVLQQQQRSAAVSGVAPQVPVVSTLEQNCGLLPKMNDTMAHHSPHTKTARDNVASAVRDNVASAVRDNVASAVRDNVASPVREYPAVTGGVAAPHSASDQDPQQRSGTGDGSSGNALSCGSTFTSDRSYTGQALKRRNVVRFRHRGAQDKLPDRRLVIRELLCNQMGFLPTNILAVINLPEQQGYDVSFKVSSELRNFWAKFFKFRDVDGWNKFTIIPISKPDAVNVSIIFWNEAVPPQDIVIWLQKHCDLMSDLTKIRDADGIWTGAWRVLVKLRQRQNIIQHLPNYLYIGREKGICFYADQPRECYKCDRTGHLESVCAYSVVECNLCGEVSHASAMGQNIRCNLCGWSDRPHGDCPDSCHYEDPLVAAENLEEIALLSGWVLTRPDPQSDISDLAQDQPQSGITEGDMEVVEQAVQNAEGASSPASGSTSENNDSVQVKRRKKDESSRKSEGEKCKGQRPTKKKANSKTADIS